MVAGDSSIIDSIYTIWSTDTDHIEESNPLNSWLIVRSGIEPAIQFKLTDSIVGAAGVLFTVAGQNARDAIYPNFAFQWYWNRGKQVIMR